MPGVFAISKGETINDNLESSLARRVQYRRPIRNILKWKQYIEEYNSLELKKKAIFELGLQNDFKMMYQRGNKKNSLDNLCIECNQAVLAKKGENCYNLHCPNMITKGILFAHKECTIAIVRCNLRICIDCISKICEIEYMAKRLYATTDLEIYDTIDSKDWIVIHRRMDSFFLWNNPQKKQGREIFIKVQTKLINNFGIQLKINEYKANVRISTNKSIYTTQSYNTSRGIMHERRNILCDNLNVLHFENIFTTDDFKHYHSYMIKNRDYILSKDVCRESPNVYWKSNINSHHIALQDIKSYTTFKFYGVGYKHVANLKKMKQEPYSNTANTDILYQLSPSVKPYQSMPLPVYNEHCKRFKKLYYCMLELSAQYSPSSLLPFDKENDQFWINSVEDKMTNCRGSNHIDTSNLFEGTNFLCWPTFTIISYLPFLRGSRDKSWKILALDYVGSTMISDTKERNTIVAINNMDVVLLHGLSAVNQDHCATYSDGKTGQDVGSIIGRKYSYEVIKRLFSSPDSKQILQSDIRGYLC